MNKARELPADGSLAVKVVAGVGVLVLSFWISLQLIDAQHGESTRWRSAAEIDQAQLHAMPVAGGLRVYTPDMAAQAPYTPDRIFGGQRGANSFWEAHGGFPIDLIVILPAVHNLGSYSLSAGAESIDRMPLSWELDGSTDGVNWFALDKRPPVARWAPGETRSYTIAAPRAATLLRLRILACADPNILRIYGIALN